MSDVYVVIGMHRTGTSLVSSMLHVAGVEMCRHRCGQGTATQPYGYFEDEQFKALNNLILDNSGGDWKHPPKANKIVHGVKPFHRAMDMQIRARAVNRPDWGWKDPRTVLTAGHWHQLLVAVGYKPHYVFTERNKEQVVASLAKRPNSKGMNWAVLYDDYQSRVNDFRNLVRRRLFPFITINFYRLVHSQPYKEAWRLAGFAKCRDDVDKMVAQIRVRPKEENNG